MKTLNFIPLIVFLIFLSGCSKDHLFDAFKSAGPEASITRKTESFNQIRVGEKFDVLLVQDTIEKVIIEADWFDTI